MSLNSRLKELENGISSMVGCGESAERKTSGGCLCAVVQRRLMSGRKELAVLLQ